MNTTDGYVRSSNNPGAVVNTDNGALQAYKLRKQKETQINNLSSQVDNLNNEISDIKNLLSQILEKLK